MDIARIKDTVFQALEHTAEMEPKDWRILSKAHAMRNQNEYEGYLEVNEGLVTEIIRIAKKVAEKLNELGAVGK